VHPNCEIVQAAQKHIRRDGSRIENLQKKLGRRFHEFAVADEVEGFVPHRRYPSALGWAGFERGHCVHDILPCPFGHDGVAVLQVSLGDLQVDGGLAHGLIFGLDDLPGGVLVRGVNAGAFASDFVKAIIHPTPDATMN
jgi:hypothetical protein